MEGQGRNMRTSISRRDSADLPAPAMDIQDALGRLGNDEELLSAIVKIYLEDSPALLERIQTAVATGDSKGLQIAAHSLKGLAVTLSASDVAGAASRLEHMGGNRNLAEVESCVCELLQAVSELDAQAKGRVSTARSTHH
jgi:HPt (histidine-containing phosphotransfer) domain-containing protein